MSNINLEYLPKKLPARGERGPAKARGRAREDDKTKKEENSK